MGVAVGDLLRATVGVLVRRGLGICRVIATVASPSDGMSAGVAVATALNPSSRSKQVTAFSMTRRVCLSRDSRRTLFCIEDCTSSLKYFPDSTIETWSRCDLLKLRGFYPART